MLFKPLCKDISINVFLSDALLFWDLHGDTTDSLLSPNALSIIQLNATVCEKHQYSFCSYYRLLTKMPTPSASFIVMVFYLLQFSNKPKNTQSQGR